MRIRSLLAVVTALLLTGCSAVEDDTSNREAGWLTKPTVVCVVNKALQPVDIFFGSPGQYGATEVSREYWYWDSLNNGKKNSGVVTLDTGKTVCSTSSDSDNTLTGPVDVKVRVYTKEDKTELAYFGFNNETMGRPAFYPQLIADDWFGLDQEGSIQISTDQFDSYRCQVNIWNFNVIRLRDLNSDKNWKFEILGPANINDWPEQICTKKG